MIKGRMFHQTFEGAYGTKKVKNSCSVGTEKSHNKMCYQLITVFPVAVLGALLSTPPATPASAARRPVHQPRTQLCQRPLLSTQPARRRLQSRERPVREFQQLPACRPHAFGPLRYAESICCLSTV